MYMSFGLVVRRQYELTFIKKKSLIIPRKGINRLGDEAIAITKFVDQIGE